MKAVFFRDIEIELVDVMPSLLSRYGETDFKVATQKQQISNLNQYIIRSENNELVGRVLKAEDVALTVYIKNMGTENASYIEGKRLAQKLEGILPMLPKHSNVISWVENVDLNVNDFNSVSQVYTIFFTFTVYHKGQNER